MKFADFICFKAIIPELKSEDRDGVIAELVESLDKAGQLGKASSKAIIKAVIKRENEASTGMGKGVAVPLVKQNITRQTWHSFSQRPLSLVLGRSPSLSSLSHWDSI